MKYQKTIMYTAGALALVLAYRWWMKKEQDKKIAAAIKPATPPIVNPPIVQATNFTGTQPYHPSTRTSTVVTARGRGVSRPTSRPKR